MVDIAVRWSVTESIRLSSQPEIALMKHWSCRSISIAGLCLCFLGKSAAGFRERKIPVIPRPAHRFTVIAHRGLYNHVPENSLASFESGARAGVDYVEMDLRTTGDSVLVILHDATLNRTTDGSGILKDSKYADLKKLRLKNGTAKSRFSIPTFEEALAVCHDKVGIYLDFKSASVVRTMKLIRRYSMSEQVIVYVNSPEQYAEWRKLEPGMPLMVSLPDTVKTVAGLNAFIHRFPVALLDGDYSGYSKQMLKAAAAAGVVVWPDIQGNDEQAHWQAAIDTGFSGLQTDHPQALIEWLKQKDLR